MSDVVVLKTFPTRFEAELCKSFLASYNIESFIQADDEGDIYPYPLKPTTVDAKLFIQKTDLVKAKKIITQIKDK